MSDTAKKRVAAIAAAVAVYGLLSYNGQVPTIPELVSPPDGGGPALIGPDSAGEGQSPAGVADDSPGPAMPIDPVEGPGMNDLYQPEPSPALGPPPGM